MLAAFPHEIFCLQIIVGGHLPSEMNNEDMGLVQAYATGQSEAAFAELVSRHVGLVYSAALRQLGDAHLAQDVTQAVFVILSRKAGSLNRETILSGWLYRTTRFACADVLRRERRRQRREEEAHMEAITEQNTHDPAWRQLSPVLDEAMARLRDRDRDALVLRFFENKSMKEVAESLELDERAAQKRVQRALEKLRGLFARRGVTLSVAVIASTVAANSVSAAPAPVIAFAASAGAAQATTPATNAIIQGALRAMAWAKLKFSLAVGTAVFMVGAVATLAFAQLANKPETVPLDHAAATVPITPGPGALILVGLIATDAPEQIQSLADDTKKNLIARGFDSSHVEILSGKISREQILQKLHALAGSVREEFWLVLLGQTGRAQGGGPAFQVSGPRLTAADLKPALDAIPGRQFVFIGTGNAGGFLPVLADGRRTVLSATMEQGEPDQPRFLPDWVKQFAATPQAPFADIAARASAEVSEYCKKSNISQSEHAQLADPASGKILNAPFGVNVPPATNQTNGLK